MNPHPAPHATETLANTAAEHGGHANMVFLNEVLLLLVAAVVVVAVFRRLHLPPILGYLFVGVALGPFGLGQIEANHVSSLAELGVVFLLFSIGLEFSLPKMFAMRHAVFVVGGLQVVITAVVAGGITWLLGQPMSTAFVVGGAVAMSSTAVVVKQLTEQVELNAEHGRQALGVLLFQDLAVVPFLILIPKLSSGLSLDLLPELGYTMLAGTAVFVAMLAAGYWALRPLLREVAHAQSSELFTLTVLLITLLSAWLTEQAGLSLVLGAFLAGMMLSETEFRHQIELDIRPFQNVFMGLFFISVGMMLDVFAVGPLLHWILLALVGIVVGKALIIFLLVLQLQGGAPGVALRTALVLAQGGEFGFVLLTLAVGHGLLTPETKQIVLSAAFLSILLTPFIIRYNEALVRRFCVLSYHGDTPKQAEAIREEAKSLRDHVILCGFGRVGQNMARMLEQENFQWLALETNPQIVREARDAGELVEFGDAGHGEFLQAAGVERARAVVITFIEHHATLKIIHAVREENPDIPLLVRTLDDTHSEDYRRAGANEVVPELLESSLMMGSHLLLMLEVREENVLQNMRQVWAERYQLLRRFFHAERPVFMDASEVIEDRLHTVVLPDEAHAVGKSFADLDLAQAEVAVDALCRGDIRGENPGPEVVLQAQDGVVLYGKPDALSRAEKILLQG